MAVIKIKPSHESQGDHVLINEEDFNPDIHELFDAPAKLEDGDQLRVAKGPGGRLYLKLGKETFSGPFDTQEEADAALAKEQAA